MDGVKVHLSKEDNVVLQAIAAFDLLFELSNRGFLKRTCGREFISRMGVEGQVLEEAGLINQGVILCMLYALLALPPGFTRQRGHAQPDGSALQFDVLPINAMIERFAAEGTARSAFTYERDRRGTDHVRHIRNAIAHGKMAFCGDSPEGDCVRQDRLRLVDENAKGETYCLEIPLFQLSQICTALKEMFYAYLRQKGAQVPSGEGKKAELQ